MNWKKTLVLVTSIIYILSIFVLPEFFILVGIVYLIIALYTIQSDCKAMNRKPGLWLTLSFFLGPIGGLIYVFKFMDDTSIPQQTQT